MMKLKGRSRRYPAYGSKMYSIVHGKCPRCQQGELFVSANPYKVGQMIAMCSRCEVCKTDFPRETGFYSVALWTSYPKTILIALIFMLLYLLVLHLSMLLFFIFFSLSMLLLPPIIMRLGRAILLNMFIDFDPNTHK